MDFNGEREVILIIWSPNKKTKETTVQINSRKGNGKLFVKQFAELFVQEKLENWNYKGWTICFKKERKEKPLC